MLLVLVTATVQMEASEEMQIRQKKKIRHA